MRKVLDQTIIDYDFKKHRKDKNWGQKLVVPGQTMSLKEMLHRHKHRLPVPPVEQDMQSVDMRGLTFDDVNPLEKTADKLTTADSMREELTVLQKVQKDKMEAKKKAEEDAKLEAERKVKEDEAKKNAES